MRRLQLKPQFLDPLAIREVCGHRVNIVFGSDGLGSGSEYYTPGWQPLPSLLLTTHCSTIPSGQTGLWYSLLHPESLGQSQESTEGLIHS